jgi:hypothetical protein
MSDADVFGAPRQSTGDASGRIPEAFLDRVRAGRRLSPHLEGNHQGRGGRLRRADTDRLEMTRSTT